MESEPDREWLPHAVEELVNDASDNTTRLTRAVTQIITEVQESLARTPAPREMQEFIEQ